MKHADEDESGALDRDEFINFLNEKNVDEGIDGKQNNEGGTKQSIYEKEFEDAQQNYHLFRNIIMEAR